MAQPLESNKFQSQRLLSAAEVISGALQGWLLIQSTPHSKELAVALNKLGKMSSNHIVLSVLANPGVPPEAFLLQSQIEMLVMAVHHALHEIEEHADTPI